MDLISLLPEQTDVHCLIDNKCPYRNKSRATCVVYKVECNTKRKFYIGNTQQALKKRMGGHYADVLRLVKKKQNSDTFAKHFASTITN